MMVLPSVLDFVTKEVKIIKVVETGIFNLVKISKMVGAATYRYSKSTGAVSKPLLFNLS